MNDLIAALGTSQRFPLLALIPLFPLLGALGIAALRPFRGPVDPAEDAEGRTLSDRWLVHGIAVGAVALSFVVALLSFVTLTMQAAPEHGEARLAFRAWDWLSTALVRGGDVGFIDVHVGFAFDALSGTMCLVVTGIGLLIHVYSTGYMHEEPSYHRFFAYLNLFTAAMLILVLGDSLPLLFVGWEGVGLCSYLLIGFWYENPAYAAAGKKAFIVNRIGDVGVLIAMFIFATYCHSLDFEGIRQNASALTGGNFVLAIFHAQPVELPMTVATLACLALFLGCAGKSAQIPLYVWLPDAMAGPTPVSALIHAATMVTAGVYLVARMSFVFVLSPPALAVIATVGALTALFAASIGLVQNDLKKVLAYSTVSQLGFMFLGAGVGAFSESFFHVFTHAFFKACLFLGAGAVMHAVGAHGDVDVRTLGGLRKRLPRTHLTFLLAALALAGFPLTSGFFSKDEILYKALATPNPAAPWLDPVLFGIGVAAAFMTAFYIFRVYFLTFHGSWRGGPSHDEHGHGAASHADVEEPAADAHGAEPPPSVHEAGPAMTVPLLVLAAGATVVGFLEIPHWTHLPNIWEAWVGHSFATTAGAAHAAEGAAQPALHGFDASVGIALAAGLVAMASGLGLAYTWYLAGDGSGGKKLAEAVPWLHRAAYRKFYVDELYDATFVRGTRGLASLMAAFDRVVVDGILVKLTSLVVIALGHLASRLHTGRIQTYGAAMAVGIAAIVWWVAVPHVEVRTRVEDAGRVTAEASAGPGYRYRWRVLDGARPDTPVPSDWSEERELTRSFARVRQVRLEVEVQNALGHRTTETVEVDLTPAAGSAR